MSSSRRYQQSLNRNQTMLLPPSVEEYVSQQNTVRAINAYVDTLNLQSLGFTNTEIITEVGQPAYNPAALLKLYLYGYLQRTRSSRQLERETCRNLEVIWLIEGLRPSYKTIANFRKDNSKALKAVNRDFLLLCKELDLFGGEEVAVDGSFFKADASKTGIYTEDSLNKSLAALDKKIERYQSALEQQDKADDKAGKGSLIEDDQLEEKIKQLQSRQKEKEALQQRLKDSGQKQISTVDKDARLLKKRGQTTAGYNVQIAVDSKHKLIVAEEVTQDGNDSALLAPMLEKAQELLGSEKLTGLADTGYHNGKQLKACEEQDITVYVAIPKQASAAAQQGRFALKDSHYNAEEDYYHCPQGNKLLPRKKPQQKEDKKLFIYRSQATDCNSCPLRTQYLSAKASTRKIERWEHQAVVEQNQQRMRENPETVRQRGALVEHPFGTLKHRAGMHHFLMRGLEKCAGEFSLMVLGYNFTRVINTLGVDAFRDYCVQRQENREISVEYG